MLRQGVVREFSPDCATYAPEKARHRYHPKSKVQHGTVTVSQAIRLCSRWLYTRALAMGRGWREGPLFDASHVNGNDAYSQIEPFAISSVRLRLRTESVLHLQVTSQKQTVLRKPPCRHVGIADDVAIMLHSNYCCSLYLSLSLSWVAYFCGASGKLIVMDVVFCGIVRDTELIIFPCPSPTRSEPEELSALISRTRLCSSVHCTTFI